MKLYWACAKYRDENGKIQTLSTYDSALDMSLARKTIADWKRYWKYDLRKAWIDIYERSVKLQRVYIDVNNGQILRVTNYRKGE